MRITRAVWYTQLGSKGLVSIISESKARSDKVFSREADKYELDDLILICNCSLFYPCRPTVVYEVSTPQPSNIQSVVCAQYRIMLKADDGGIYRQVDDNVRKIVTPNSNH